MISFTPQPATESPIQEKPVFSPHVSWNATFSQLWVALAASVFLVSVPVFVQAPLVRTLPWLGLASTAIGVFLSFQLMSRPKTRFWGDLLLGFSWSWLAGSIYWGWFRWEPFLHLPIEAIGVPFALWCLVRQWGKVGSYFYLGSLLGTAITDLYFYLTNLIPYWRRLMQVEPDGVASVLRGALAQISDAWGICCAATLVIILVIISIFPLGSRQIPGWTFSGAVLGTILVDGLFWLVASFA
ncbi:MAG: DUF3120 domain-containing protein [Scytolyngbya sp. HA4215-MV1]|nr:DUF3120 domain-containing protein [Scytolyngbya sp. HA4215-MV1]